LYKKEKELDTQPVLLHSTAHIFVKSLRGNFKLYATDILICKSNGNYIDIESEDHQIYKYKGSLKKLINILPTCEFVRISKNTIIPLGKIKSKEDSYIELKDKSIHSLGSNYIQKFDLLFNLKNLPKNNQPNH
jgi:DNA-binding LytR/AlgR family response regulator